MLFGEQLSAGEDTVLSLGGIRSAHINQAQSAPSIEARCAFWSGWGACRNGQTGAVASGFKWAYLAMQDHASRGIPAGSRVRNIFLRHVEF